jgi:hypothetical protein
MLGDGDESQVTASHQYLTAGLKKKFPKYPKLRNLTLRRSDMTFGAGEDRRRTIGFEEWA